MKFRFLKVSLLVAVLSLFGTAVVAPVAVHANMSSQHHGFVVPVNQGGIDGSFVVDHFGVHYGDTNQVVAYGTYTGTIPGGKSVTNAGASAPVTGILGECGGLGISYGPIHLTSMNGGHSSTSDLTTGNIDTHVTLHGQLGRFNPTKLCKAGNLLDGRIKLARVSYLLNRLNHSPRVPKR